MEALLGSISALFSITYISLLYAVKWGWERIPGLSTTQTQSFPFVSVIIVARNEEHRIVECLQSLQNQNYPAENYELLVVDDFSTDSTVEKIKNTNIQQARVICLSEHMPDKRLSSNKKAALEAGVRHASGKYLLVTDADCICPESWIRTTLAAMEQQNLNFVTGPVCCFRNDSFLGMYQLMDLAGLMIFTGAGFQNKLILSANGANMGFRKEAFEAVDGYDGFRHLASGDDVFLLGKIETAFPGTTGYAKSVSCMVTTYPQPDFKSFVAQRVRWASKVPAITHKGTRFFLFFMMGYYWLLAFSFVLLWIHPFWTVVFALLFLSKVIGDYPVIRHGMAFTGQSVSGITYLTAEIFQVFYSLLAGLILIFRRTYTWKGRLIR